MNVSHILKLKGSTTVETVPAQATVGEASARLSQKRIGALVVSNPDGSVAGILSERDIVNRIGQEGATALAMPVHSIMTAKVECCAPGDTAMSVLERMTNGRFRHMPVMEGGSMTGLLSIGDVVKARINEIEAENEAMQEMLKG